MGRSKRGRAYGQSNSATVVKKSGVVRFGLCASLLFIVLED